MTIILLLTQNEFENMEHYFIQKKYTSPVRNQAKVDNRFDVRFADFTIEKDIILTSGSFVLVIFNDYVENSSTLVTYIKDGYYQKYRTEFKFKSIDKLYSKLNFYKSFLNKKNGTRQAIDWIINSKLMIKENDSL